MWFAFRLLLAVIGFVIRYRSRRRSLAMERKFRGVPYFCLEQTSKRKLIGFEIGMKRRSPTWARMHSESWADRAFKRAGMTTETETGDVAFDDKVYLTCDHPSL